MNDVKYYFYIVSKDYGFSPNPFYNFCTLACCKSGIRKTSKKNDWIIGLGSKSLKCRAEIIYAMKVTEILNFNSYFKDQRFQLKKPIVYGSLKTMHGDNIYHQKLNRGKWIQSDSQHHHKCLEIRKTNIKMDTKSEKVLISNHFFYFGDKYRILKQNKSYSSLLKQIQEKTKGLQSSYKYKGMENLGKKLSEFLNTNYEKNQLYGDPINWSRFFYRNQLKENK